VISFASSSATTCGAIEMPGIIVSGQTIKAGGVAAAGLGLAADWSVNARSRGSAAASVNCTNR
jgi:hypothetical protein